MMMMMMMYQRAAMIGPCRERATSTVADECSGKTVLICRGHEPSTNVLTPVIPVNTGVHARADDVQ